MKNLVSTFATVVFLAVVVQIGVAQSSSGASMGSDDKTVAAITKLEHDWEKAMQNKDDATVGKIMADGWIGLNPDGSTEGKSQFLSEVKKGDYQNLKLESVNVKSFGNTAVATGKASEPKMGSLAYMDVFMRQGGGWKAVASQVGIIQAAK